MVKVTFAQRSIFYDGVLARTGMQMDLKPGSIINSDMNLSFKTQFYRKLAAELSVHLTKEPSFQKSSVMFSTKVG